MKKVLIVDNNQETLDIMLMILDQGGYQTVTADSYRTILPIIYNNKPDIIILDVMLENEDGRNICLQLKNTERTKDICIILLSAYPDKLKNPETYLANGILEKPFNLDDLLNAVKICE